MKPWLLVPALVLSCSFAAANAQTYTVTDLGVLPNYPYAGTYPTAVNESGEVTGSDVSYFIGAPGVPIGEAFLYRDGKISPLSGEYSYGYAITGDNREGGWHGDEERRKLRVVGSAQFNGMPGPGSAFLYQDHLLRNLGFLPGGTFSVAKGVNSFGEIVGTADTNEGVYVAFLFCHGNMISLGKILGGIGSDAVAINNWGDVAGVIHKANFEDRAFLYHKGRAISLGTLPGAQVSAAAAINDSLEITGTANTFDFEFQHAFLWSKGRMIDLGLLPNGTSSQAAAINAWGEVVGQATVNTLTSFNIVPFLYSHGKMRDLNEFLPPNSGWVLDGATGINNRGQIVGTGTLNGVGAAFLMSPDCRDFKNKDCGFCRDEH